MPAGAGRAMTGPIRTSIIDDFPAIRARMEELRGASKPVVVGLDLGGAEPGVWYRFSDVGQLLSYRFFTAAEIRELEGLTVAPKTEPPPPPPPQPPPRGQ